MPSSSPHIHISPTSTTFDIEKHAPVHDPVTVQAGGCLCHSTGNHRPSPSRFFARRIDKLTPARPPFANPSPLGLVSFANSTFLISLINVQARGISQPNIATGMAFFVGGLAQFVSGVCELATGNSFGMTVSCSYGGYWMSIGLLFW